MNQLNIQINKVNTTPTLKNTITPSKKNPKMSNSSFKLPKSNTSAFFRAESQMLDLLAQKTEKKENRRIENKEEQNKIAMLKQSVCVSTEKSTIHPPNWELRKLAISTKAFKKEEDTKTA